jgi:uncharacterized membrane protein YozB (DUF420 family)
MNEITKDNPRRLRNIILALAVTYVLTFLGGFLQDTPFNFVNYIFFLLLMIGGIALIRKTLNTETAGLTKGILLLTGISTALLFIFYLAYEFFRLNANEGMTGSIEGYLYLFTLLFWILVVISLALIRRMRPV